MLIAVGATTIGFAFDAGSGNKELSGVFAACYLIGCVAAVLAVRQQSVFTAVVQPPLILFAAVPSAYFLFHKAEIDGLKDILINCGYPLIERFLLMFTTSVIVLLIGMARWYFHGSANAATPAASSTRTAAKAVAGAGLLAGLKAKLSGTADADGEPRKHAIDRGNRRAQPATGRRPAKRPAPTRSRHARPPTDDGVPPPNRPRRRPTHAVDDDAPPPPRRRPAGPRERDRRVPPPDYRRTPRERPDRERPDRERTEPYERPARRPNRYAQDPFASPYSDNGRRDDGREAGYGDGYSYGDSDAPPPRRRPAANGTHHPISNVRYRGQAAGDGEDRVQYRRRPPRQDA